MDVLTSALEGATGSDPGGRVSVVWMGDHVELSAVPATDWGEREREAAQARMRLDMVERPVNHLVCLGQGEMLERTVIALYADRAGNISRTQTLFGLDERAEVYDYGSSEDDQLEDAGRQLLREYQETSECDLLGNEQACVGDIIAGRDSRLGVYVAARVTRKSYIVERGRATITVEAGNPRIS